MTIRRRSLKHFAIIATMAVVIIGSAIYFGYPEITSKAYVAREYDRINISQNGFKLQSKEWYSSDEDKHIGRQQSVTYTYVTDKPIKEAEKIVVQSLGRAGYSVDASQNSYITATRKNYYVDAQFTDESNVIGSKVSLEVVY